MAQPPLLLWPQRRPSIFDSPAARAARENFGSPLMPLTGTGDLARFAILAPPNLKPTAYQHLDELARRILAKAPKGGLEVSPPVAVSWRDGTRMVVPVYGLGLDQGRQDLIGYVWLGGRETDHETLKRALYAQRPPRLEPEAA